MNSITPTKSFQRTDKNGTFFPRLARLEFLLSEIGKPYDERHPEMAAIAGPETEFDMTFVTVGRRIDNGRLFVQRCDMVGLASLDPWFQRLGLSPSIITHPHSFDTLDIGGVMLVSERSGNPIRVSWKDTELCEFFGLGLADWQVLNDAEAYWNRRKERVVITSALVLEALDAAVLMRYGVSLAVVRASIEQDKAA